MGWVRMKGGMNSVPLRAKMKYLGHLKKTGVFFNFIKFGGKIIIL
uniref:Uncharacterized protein n=1 Tax=Nelumbo nucifera TaxID=4432 RepID=A0A822ZQS9_NELNU|nr:TPA_asm: hypothetical protein HUJ06_003929 [Nelumbo nucifera]